MARIIPLDAGVVGLLICSPGKVPDAAACTAWLEQIDSAGARVVIPDVTHYEVLRGLLAIKATAKLRRLAVLEKRAKRARVSPKAWVKAAEFWADARSRGLPTARPESLDADAVLAAVAATIGRPGDMITIATANQRHLGRFPGIDARDWRNITT